MLDTVQNILQEEGVDGLRVSVLEVTDEEDSEREDFEEHYEDKAEEKVANTNNIEETAIEDASEEGPVQQIQRKQPVEQSRQQVLY